MTERLSIIWLKTACIVTFLAGLISTAASTQSGSAPWLLLFDLLKWPLDGDPASFQSETFAVNAVLGGVMAGWATLMYLIITNLLIKGNRDVARYMLLALIVWFLLDSAGSWLAGLPGNIILNIIFLFLFLVPLTALVKRRV